jgi:hypothetical protein
MHAVCTAKQQLLLICRYHVHNRYTEQQIHKTLPDRFKSVILSKLGFEEIPPPQLRVKENWLLQRPRWRDRLIHV